MRRFLIGLLLTVTASSCSTQLGYRVGWTSVAYAKEGVNGIRQVTTVKGADPKTFEVVADRYGKDDSHVYYEGQLLENCDPATLELLGDKNLYCRDAKRVYLGHRTLSQDAPNFELVGAGYSKDGQAVYFLGKTVEGADPSSWKSYVKGPYGSDDQTVFHEGEVLPGASPDSFEALNYHYGKDEKAVWFDELPIEGADAGSAEAVGKERLKDRGHAYYRERPIEGLDVGSAEFLEGYYSKDQQSVFYQDKKIEEADAASFEVTKDKILLGRDKNFVYSSGKKSRPNSGDG